MWFLFGFLFQGAFAQSGSPFSEYFGKKGEIKKPQRASLAGEYGAASWSHQDLLRGSMSIQSGISFPEGRGQIRAKVIPTYSIVNGQSEWGLGFANQLLLQRARVLGPFNYSDDDILSPWGKLVKSKVSGVFYPQGWVEEMELRFPTPEVGLVTLKNGDIYEFGGEIVSGSLRGVHHWHLKSIRTHRNELTTLQYLKKHGKWYLVSVYYAGRVDAPASFLHKIEFDFEEVDGPGFVDFRSGERQELSLRISRIHVFSKSQAGTWLPSYAYELGHEPIPNSLGFRLKSVKKRFQSGECLPAFTFSYGPPKEASFAVNERYTAELTKFRKLFDLESHTIFDYDRSGRVAVDVQHSTPRLYLDRGDTIDIVDLSVSSGESKVYPKCRPQSKTNLWARNIQRIRGVLATPEIVVSDFVKDPDSDAELTVCDLYGNLEFRKIVPRNWYVGAEAYLVDIRNTGTPDLIRVTDNGSIQSYLNLSTKEKIQFEETFSLRAHLHTPPGFRGMPSHLAFVDINGDGLIDLVGITGNKVWVWYGKGNYDFESIPIGLDINGLGDRTHSFDPEMKWEFVDLTKNGVPDLLGALWNEGLLYKFFNLGSRLSYDSVVSKSRFGSWKLVPGNLTGSGETQFAFRSHKEVFSYELTHPSLGVLTQAQDGKGNALHFEYSRFPATPGLGTRPIIVSAMERHSAGELGVSRIEFNYGKPVIDSRNGVLLGFGEVSQTTPMLFSKSEFFLAEDQNAKPIFESRWDPRQPALKQSTEFKYEEREHKGLGYKRLREKELSFEDGQKKIRSLEYYRSYAREFCPNHTETWARGQTLHTRLEYNPADLVQCLPSKVSLEGVHPDTPNFDFSHAIAIERNEKGDPIHIKKLGVGGHSSQKIEYTPQFQVRAIWEAGKGIESYYYDSLHRLIEVGYSDQISLKVDSFQEAEDLILSLSTDHGHMKGVFKEHYNYDGLGRLSRTWNSQYPSSQVDPIDIFMYRYAELGDTLDASIPSRSVHIQKVGPDSKKLKVSLETASGRPIGHLAWNWVNYSSSKIKKYDPSQGTEQLDLGVESTDLEHGVAMKNLLVGTIVGSSQQHGLAFKSMESKAIQRDLIKKLRTEAHIREQGIEYETSENDVFKTSLLKGIDGTKLVYTSELGKQFRFEYDALKRLRRVHLPDKTSHFIEYDALGRVVASTRSGSLKVTTKYVSNSDLPIERSFFDKTGKASFRVHTTFDAIGRKVQDKYTDPSKKSIIYSYFYDGEGPDGSRENGLMGFLTGIRGPDFERSLKYQADGKLIKDTLRLPRWGITWMQTTSYLSDGSVSVQSFSNQSGTTQTLVTGFNSFGKVQSFSTANGPFATFDYDGSLQVKSIRWPQTNAIDEFSYDVWTHGIMGFIRRNLEKPFQVAWNYDQRGQVAFEKMTLGTQSRTQDYKYTAEAQLKSEGTDLDHLYDEMGNWIGSPKIQQYLKQDSKKWCLEEPQKAPSCYPIDSFGRVIGTPDGATFAYNAQGKIGSISRPGSKVEYGYTQEGHRLFKTLNGEIQEIYWGTALLTKTRALQSVNVQGLTIGLLDNEKFIPLPTDVRGSLIEEGATLINAPSAYGERSEPLKSEYARILSYVNQGYDFDLKAYRFGQRDYSPTLKRFLTPDWIFFEQPDLAVKKPFEANLYGYAKGNPLSFSDPEGEFAFLLPMVGFAFEVSAVVGTAESMVRVFTAISESMAIESTSEAVKYIAESVVNEFGSDLFLKVPGVKQAGGFLKGLAQEKGGALLKKFSDGIKKNKQAAHKAVGAAKIPKHAADMREACRNGETPKFGVTRDRVTGDPISPGDNTKLHFGKHREDVATKYFGIAKNDVSLEQYMELGRKGIAEGTYHPERNAYYLGFVNTSGIQNYIWVGLKNRENIITTIHITEKIKGT